MPRIKLFKRTHTAKIPVMKTEGAFAFDLYSDVNYHIASMARGRMDTGLTMEIPEGYALRIVPRSGKALEGLMIANSPGTIDDDYRGPIEVIIINVTDHPKHIEKGDRIAQCYLERKIPIVWQEVGSITDLSVTKRGGDGFGSTGDK